MNTIIGFISGVIVCALSVYFTLDWQEEKLEYSISSPALFGATNYQTLTIQNSGWNPAENLDIYIKHQSITFKNIKSDTNLTELNSIKNGVFNLDRLRRDEAAIVSIVYEGKPLVLENIKIKSDRSIAKPIDVNNKNGLNEVIAMLTSILSGVLITLIGVNYLSVKSKEEKTAAK
ncbi:hypothetical protein R0K04_01380 [Pseudoalteromonas sp. SIMBA_153]